MADRPQQKTGALPYMPGMNNTSPPTSGSGSRLVSEVQRSFADGAQLHAFYRAMGMDPPGSTPPPAKQEEKTSTSVDLGAVVKALGDQNSNMLGHVIQMSQSTKSGGNDPFLQFMMGELKDMRQQLVQAQQHPQQKDPMEVMTAYVDRYASLMDRFKKDLNLPANMQLGANNENVAIQLKKMDLEQRDRELQWQAQQHQWQVEREERQEDRAMMREQFQAQHQLKVRELDEAAKKSSDAAGWLQDLAAVFVGSVEQNAPGTALHVAAKPPAEEPAYYPPKAFRCQSGTPMCGARVPIAPGAVEAICPQCGMEYDLVPQSVAQQPPAAPEAEQEALPEHGSGQVALAP